MAFLGLIVRKDFGKITAMAFSTIIILVCLLSGPTWASVSPGLTCPNPDFAALLVRVNYLEIEVKSCKDLVNGIDNLEELTAALETIEGLSTLPDDLASLKEDTEADVAALGGSINDLSSRVDDLEAGYDSRLSGLDSSVSTLQTSVTDLSGDLADEISARGDADAGLQSNIDGLSVS